MKIPQVSAGSVSALLLVVLMVSSANATPLLSVGKNANYQLNASLQVTQSCNAIPVTYNQTACGPYQPKETVYIHDDAACAPLSAFCNFSPADLTVVPGTTVMWFNAGQLVHTVTSSGVPSFTANVVLLNPKASFSFTFTATGN